MKDPIWVADVQKSQGTVLFFSENRLPLLVGLASVSSVQFILADAQTSSPPSTFAGLRFHVVSKYKIDIRHSATTNCYTAGFSFEGSYSCMLTY